MKLALTYSLLSFALTSVGVHGACGACGGCCRRDLGDILDSVTAMGGAVLNEEQLSHVGEECKNEEYEVSLLYSPGPHFFLGAVAQESEVSGCSAFGFESAYGGKYVVQGNPDDFDKYVFEGVTFSLDEVLRAFEKATPIEGDGYDPQHDACTHFAQRIWLELGLSGSEEVGNFIVDNAVNDSNFINFARSRGGVALFAATLLGPDAMKIQIEDMVFSQIVHRELETSNTDGTSILDTMQDVDCSQQKYLVDLIIFDGANIKVLIEPKSHASGCPNFLLGAKKPSLEKEHTEIEDMDAFRAALTANHAIVSAEGEFNLGDIMQAYEEAPVYADGQEGEPYHPAFNNHGDFIARFFENLRHCSSEAETLSIAANLMLSEEGLGEILRGSVDSSLANGMTDLEVVAWAVRERTQNMYCTE